MRMLAAVLALVCGLGASVPAEAASAADEIRARLHAWADAFNRRDVDATCELFAPDLQYDTRAASGGTRDLICARLRRVLEDPSYKGTNRAEVLSILVAGDMAAVRIAWTLTEEKDGRTVQSREPGLDVFRRDTDGVWRIVRFMALVE
ncbi:nuclear transport factor 2 family protein [Xanthobacter dioxanivorans]|uniref:Nuclear transport factor 2 family protein n=1 Tax=Xanthobacter dioxanivorans TaxID=2528964 RepID=A0A974SI14_9HYPH|nr:nuclear transport factor 2 family protein [Xanthobacter dioxanivorans]QRG05709.1 nuclear transport factor 2 family protein [Xanthobacter dioxanivorans]